MSTLIKYLPDTALPQSRLVCSLWNRMITQSRRWQNEDKYQGTGRCRFFNHSYLEDMAISFNRFHHKFGDPTALPFPLCFTHFTGDRTLNLGDNATQNFFRTYGSYIKNFKLDRCEWSLQSFRKILLEFTPNVEHFHLVCGVIPGTLIGTRIIPELDTLLHEHHGDYPVLSKMQSLRLDMDFMSRENEPRPYVEQFITELLMSFPNLETLFLNVPSFPGRNYFLEYIAGNEKIKLTKLKSLWSSIDPQLSTITKLTMKRWPLSTLHICIRYEDVTVDALHEFLTSLKHTLTYLRIVFLQDKCAYEFPSSVDLYKLKDLHVYKYRGQLDFLKDFVALERLVIFDVDLSHQLLFNHLNKFKILLPNLRNFMHQGYQVFVSEKK